jgi:hypothetical protein
MYACVYEWEGERHVIICSTSAEAIKSVKDMREDGWKAWVEPWGRGKAISS